MVERVIPGHTVVNLAVWLEAMGGAAWEMPGQGCQTSYLSLPIGTAFNAHSHKPIICHFLSIVTLWTSENSLGMEKCMAQFGCSVFQCYSCHMKNKNSEMETNKSKCNGTKGRNGRVCGEGTRERLKWREGEKQGFSSFIVQQNIRPNTKALRGSESHIAPPRSFSHTERKAGP